MSTTTPSVRVNLFRRTDQPRDLLVQVVPPQAASSLAKPTPGAYCIVIDVSGSMGAAAAVTNDSGDKVNHGFSLLDIAKHATNTFISSLGKDDVVSIVSYSNASKQELGWTLCTDEGKAKSLAVVNSLRTMGATNLTAGVQACWKLFEDKFGAPFGARWRRDDGTSLNAIILTDGQPSSQYAPTLNDAERRNATGANYTYAMLVKGLEERLVENCGEMGRVCTTTVGLGNDINSELLATMSSHQSNFLHMPDPGCVGPFMVNLLAQLRCTATVPVASAEVNPPNAFMNSPLGRALQESVQVSQAAVHAVTDWIGHIGHQAANAPCSPHGEGSMMEHEQAPPLRLVAATHSALLVDAAEVEEVPGYADIVERCMRKSGEEALRVPLGMLAYDQPRHVLLRLKRGGDAEAACCPSISLEVCGAGACRAVEVQTVEPQSEEGRLIEVTALRLQCVAAMEEVLKQSGTSRTTLQDALRSIDASAVKEDPRVQALRTTMTDEVLPGSHVHGSFSSWGRHYLRTFSRMLRFERRSNFRDAALQEFGKDALGRSGMFEAISTEAETAFATLPPPRPSLMQRSVNTTPRGGAALPVARGYSPAPLPDEFMRGGGCLAPEGTVTALGPDGEELAMTMDRVRAGDHLKTLGGGFARVRCVVRTACEGGKCKVSRLPGGLELTEWHPVIDAREPHHGKWRFPIFLGRPVLRDCPYVYNLVLEASHVVLVSGVACVTLGHGLQDDVVRHPYWGTDAVLRDLEQKQGWADGMVTLAVEDKLQSEAAMGAMGTPPPAATLIEKTEKLRVHFGMAEGMAIAAVISTAVERLGLTAIAGASLMEKADACVAAVSMDEGTGLLAEQEGQVNQDLKASDHTLLDVLLRTMGSPRSPLLRGAFVGQAAAQAEGSSCSSSISVIGVPPACAPRTLCSSPA